MVSSASCAQIKYLRAPGLPTLVPTPSGYTYAGVPLGVYGGLPTVYSGETVSPSIYPLRTALDALNTFPNYAINPQFRLPGYPFSNTPAVITNPAEEILPIQVRVLRDIFVTCSAEQNESKLSKLFFSFYKV